MGIGGGAPSILGGFDSNVSLLELGKRFSARGIGLSSRARASSASFLSQSSTGLKIILSAGVETSIQNTQIQILAIQSRLPDSKIGSFVNRGAAADLADAEALAAENAEQGSLVDELV